MKFESPHKLISAFNFSSLNNIVMLLLIFFVLLSQFALQTGGVKVKLPGTKNNEHAQVANFSVAITDQGKIYVGYDETSLAALAGKLSAIRKSQNDYLTIRADKSVKVEVITKVIDAAKGIGINNFTIYAEKISF
jgi:biopolymer transport protein ExbD